MSAQLDMFAATEAQAVVTDADTKQRESWKLCWNWDGPQVGGVVSFQHCIHDDIDGRPCYVQMLPAKVLSIENDVHLVELLAPIRPTVSSGPDNLTRRQFKLRAADIWPYLGWRQNGPTRVIDTMELFNDPTRQRTTVE